MSKARSTPAAPPSRKHLARAAREARQRRYILIGTLVVAVVGLAVIGFGVFQQTVLHPREAVARVGNQNITLSQFVNLTRYRRLSLVQQYNQISAEMSIFGADPQTSAYLVNLIDAALRSIGTKLQSTTDPDERLKFEGLEKIFKNSRKQAVAADPSVRSRIEAGG